MKHKTIPYLDVIRFGAALVVALFHYTAYYFKTAVEPVTRFGYLGVSLFFMISGFVIAMSLDSSSSPRRFLLNRAIRIYPAFIICSVLTVAYVNLLSKWTPFTFWEFAANMTMFGEHLHVRLINGTYWSLTVEWIFYFMMFVVSTFLGCRRLHWFLWGWLLASALSGVFHTGAISKPFILHSAPYFVAGAALYLMSAEPDTKGLRWLFLLSLPVSLYWATPRGPAAEIPGQANPMVIYLIIVGCYVLMALIARLPRLAGGGPALHQIAGRASYPLYLIHVSIGSDILHRYYRPDITGAILIIALVLGMIGIAVVISEFVERPIIVRLKKAFVAPSECRRPA